MLDRYEDENYDPREIYNDMQGYYIDGDDEDYYEFNDEEISEEDSDDAWD